MDQAMLLTTSNGLACSVAINNCVFTSNLRSHLSISAGAASGLFSVGITNNIFATCQDTAIRITDRIESDEVTIQYNDFWQNMGIVQSSNDFEDHIGQLVDTNRNGDSVDVANNIFLNPDFVDGGLCLLSSSPCIDAGLNVGEPFSGFAPDIGYCELIVTTRVVMPNRVRDAFQHSAMITYPNPATTSATLLFSIAKPAVVVIQIYNVLGQLAYQSELSVASGATRIVLPAETLPSGEYIVRMSENQAIHSQRLTIVR
jgi:hypothetical protein